MLTVGLLTACSTTSAPPSAGPEAPSPIPITVNPSALPVGDTIPTAIVAPDGELILYFASDLRADTDRPWLLFAWRDRSTGAVQEATCNGVLVPEPQQLPGHFFNLRQCDLGDGRLAEFGTVWAEPSRVAVRDAGKTTEAHYGRWSRHPQITVFWLERKAKPIPPNVQLGNNETSPQPGDPYPQVTAYDAKGKTITTVRLQPSYGKVSQGA